MTRGCAAVGVWFGWVAFTLVGIATLAGAICLVGGRRSFGDYGFVLAWLGLGMGVIGALAEWFALPLLLVAMVRGTGQDTGQNRATDSGVRWRPPGISVYIASGLAALVIGRLVIALA